MRRNNFPQLLAFLISRLLGPLPLVCLLWLVTAVKSGIGFWRALWVYPLIFVVVIAIPTLVTSYLIAIKKVKDIEWSDLSQRRRYLIPITIVSLTTLVTMTKFLTNATVFHLSLLLSAIILALMAVYVLFDYKISAHIVIATITFAGINLFLHQQFMWLFLLLIPIIWARYVLKVHTLGQLVCGFVLPAAITLLVLSLFGWPQVP